MNNHFLTKAIQHPFYQDIIAGMEMMVEDLEEAETYSDLENYLEPMQEKSLEALYNL